MDEQQTATGPTSAETEIEIYVQESTTEEELEAEASPEELVGEEFYETLQELVLVEQAQLDALEHMYAGQLLSYGVLAAVLVCSILYSAINKFL